MAQENIVLTGVQAVSASSSDLKGTLCTKLSNNSPNYRVSPVNDISKQTLPLTHLNCAVFFSVPVLSYTGFSECLSNICISLKSKI